MLVNVTCSFKSRQGPACAGECSGAVAALLALITPLPYSADWRPFFTIHDPVFAALSAGELPGNSNALPRLIGVTNLYFLKASQYGSLS